MSIMENRYLFLILIFTFIIIIISLLYYLSIDGESPYNYPLGIFFDPLIGYYKPLRNNRYPYTVVHNKNIVFKNHTYNIPLAEIYKNIDSDNINIESYRYKIHKLKYKKERRIVIIGPLFNI